MVRHDPGNASAPEYVNSITRKLRALINPLTTIRQRREQAIECTVPYVLELAATRWSGKPEDVVVLSPADYSQLRRRIREDHRTRGLRYVGPWASWFAVCAFLMRITARGELIFGSAERDQELKLSMARSVGDRLEVGLRSVGSSEGPPRELDTVHQAVVRWERVTAVPLVGGRFTRR